MNGSELKAMWKSGKPGVGVWLTLVDPAVAAILSNVGFDWIFLDAEHNPFNPETMRNLLLLLRDRNTPAIVRVRGIDETLVKQLLDWGAAGILFPFVNSAEDARRAVRACHYPPDGMRGFNPREPSNFYRELDSYLATAKERTIVIAQIEHRDAVQNLDAILQVPGVDALMIGPADLSYSLGVPLQRTHPLMQDAIDTTIRKARAAGMPIGMTWEDSDEGYAKYVQQGLNWITPYADTDFLSSAAANWLTKMRGTLSA